MKKDIAIIGTVGVPANYGGFETLAENLINHPAFDFTVYCSSQSYSSKKTHYKNAKLVYIPIKANGFQSIIYDAIGIFHAVFHNKKTLLVLGVSGAFAIKLIKLIKKDITIITNIDGLEWKRSKWGFFGKCLLKYFESICVKNSDVVICDNQAICDYVKSNYQIDGQLIAYGGEHALTATDTRGDDGYFLSICRIEPENNIHTLLEAFSQRPEELKIIGNWSSSDYGQMLRKRFQSVSNLALIDPIYDVDKLFDIRKNCTAYVHGHSAGGTNPSLVEIMHFGKPVLLFDCIYNRATMQDHGFYFVDADTLTAALQSKAYLQQDTDAIQRIAQERYTWAKVSQQYADIFQSAA